MRKFLLTSAALGMLVTGAEAAPFAGGRAVGVNAPTVVDNVGWVKECNRWGHHCHWVWHRRHWR